ALRNRSCLGTQTKLSNCSRHRSSSMSEKIRADHERSDIDPAVVGWIAIGLALFVLAVPLVMPLVFPQSIYRGNPTARPALGSAAPPLEVNPSSNLRRQR